MRQLPEGTETTAAISLAALKDFADVIARANEAVDIWQPLAAAAAKAAEAADWPRAKALCLVDS